MNSRDYDSWTLFPGQASVSLGLLESGPFRQAQSAAVAAANLDGLRGVATTAAEAAFLSGQGSFLNQGLFDSLMPKFAAEQIFSEAMSASAAWEAFRSEATLSTIAVNPFFEAVAPENLNEQLQDLALRATDIGVALERALSPSALRNQLDSLAADVWHWDGFGELYAKTTAPLLDSFTAAFEGTGILDSAVDFDLSEEQEVAFEARLTKHPEVREHLEKFGKDAVKRGVLGRAVLDGLKSRPARHAYLALLVFAIGSAAYFGAIKVDGSEFSASAYLGFLVMPYGALGVHLTLQQGWADKQDKSNA